MAQSLLAYLRVYALAYSSRIMKLAEGLAPPLIIYLLSISYGMATPKKYADGSIWSAWLATIATATLPESAVVS